MEAAMMEVVERPEMSQVKQDPAREQMAKRPKNSSITQVMNAIM
jgi:hypothetical protein